MKITVLEFEDLLQGILANAREPVSAYDILGFTFGWLGELVAAGALLPLDDRIVPSAPGLFDFYPQAPGRQLNSAGANTVCRSSRQRSCCATGAIGSKRLGWPRRAPSAPSSRPVAGYSAPPRMSGDRLERRQRSGTWANFRAGPGGLRRAPALPSAERRQCRSRGPRRRGAAAGAGHGRGARLCRLSDRSARDLAAGVPRYGL